MTKSRWVGLRMGRGLGLRAVAGGTVQRDLSEKVDALRRSLLRSCSGRNRSVASQIDGLERLLLAIVRVLNMSIGATATRATLSRSVARVRQRYPRMGSSFVVHGLDIQLLRRELMAEHPEAAREMLLALVHEWFCLLHWLLGPVLVHLLEEAARDLPHRDGSPGADENWQQIPGAEASADPRSGGSSPTSAAMRELPHFRGGLHVM